MKRRILLVEDEEHLHDAIKMNLEMEDFMVTSVFNGKEALIKFKQGRYDLVILDVMLPGVNGFDICQAIRLDNKQIPILFLTAKNSSHDRINGLKVGGDDYLTKPFNLEELMLRSANLIKRSVSSPDTDIDQFRIGDHIIDFNSFEVLSENGKKNRLVSLTPYSQKHNKAM